MKIFDAQIRSDTRNDDDLRNMAYFDTVEVVTTAHAPRPFHDAASMLAYFGDLAAAEIARLAHCGLVGHVALGVLPSAQPRRAHPELWPGMAGLLALPQVVAVGEIAAWEDTKSQWALFDRQARLALEVGLPVIVTPPAELRINMTYKMMSRLTKLGLPPGQCLMNQLDEPLLRTVIEEGFVAGIAVGYRQVEPRDAACMLANVLADLPDAAKRTLLNSSLRRGAADILGVPKTIAALGDVGISRSTIAGLAFDNAHDFFRNAR